MLGRLRMSVDDAIEAYATLSQEVFSKNNRKLWWQNEAFKATTLERAFKKVVADQLKNEHKPPEESAQKLERLMDPRGVNGSCKT